MGVQISDILPKKEIEIQELSGKIIAIDAFNTLYQFLTTIRQMDGTPLMDNKGSITSHLSGLFYRTINLLQEGIQPVYVFDGKPPEMKRETIEKRKEAKTRAMEKYAIAKDAGDTEEMKKYGGRFVTITENIITESKELLKAMGIPVLQAPHEGEAEAATLAQKGFVWGAASQDYDSILYGTPYLVRNLTLSRKKKNPAGIYIDVALELLSFEDVLNTLEITHDQLICLAILVGTDYNPGGVKGLGQKTALKLVQEYETPEAIFSAIEQHEKYELLFDWKEIFSHFKEYETPNGEEPLFTPIDEEKVRTILRQRDFSLSRIDSGLEKIRLVNEKKKQTGLNQFF